MNTDEIPPWAVLGQAPILFGVQHTPIDDVTGIHHGLHDEVDIRPASHVKLTQMDSK